MKQDSKALRAAIQHCEEKAKSGCRSTSAYECAQDHAQLAKWLTELYHRRGGPWCEGCGSPVVEEGDQCHSCRDGTHDPDDMKWLSDYHEG